MDVCCLMPTYNRAAESPGLLDEAVGSFLAQDYPGHATLLIGDDTPDQHLRVVLTAEQAGPNRALFVLKWPRRFPTLGAKLAAMIEKGAGADAFCRWDDDDYSLPHRLSLSVERLGDRLEWRPSNYWWYRRGRPGEVWEVERPGNTHCMAIWRPEVLDRIGGYPLVSGDEDQQFNARLQAEGLGPAGGAGNLPHNEIFYVYRWGVSPRHLSGRGGSREKLDEQYRRIGERHVRKGVFDIRPRAWRMPERRVGLEERGQQ